MKKLAIALTILAFALPARAAFYQITSDSFGTSASKTDNTAFLQSAINQGRLRGVTVDIPPGVYKIKSPLIIDASTSLRGFGSPMIDGSGYQGTWIEYTGATTNAYMLIVTNGTANVQENIKIEGIGFLGNHVAKGILVAPSAHPQAQHSLVLDRLFLYRTRTGITFGEVVNANQTDFPVISAITCNEFTDAFMVVNARNFTCGTITGCHSSSRYLDTGIHYDLPGAALSTFVNCASGYGEAFARIGALAGKIMFIGCQWEQSTAPVPKFAIIGYGGDLFGNSGPVTFINCQIDAAQIEVVQGSRVVTMMGNNFFDSTTVLTASDVTVYDNGNVKADVDGVLVNGTFASNLNGWTAPNWTWNTGAKHTLTFTNAISQPIAVKNKWTYSFVFSIESSAGTLVPWLGDQMGQTYSGTNVSFLAFQATNTGNVDISFVPSADFDGKLLFVRYTLTAPSFLDNGANNKWITMDQLRVPQNQVAVGNTIGLMSSTNTFNYTSSNRWLQVGNYALPAKMSLGVSSEPASGFVVAGPDIGITAQNPFGGSFTTLAGGSAWSAIVVATNFPFYFAVQPEANMSTLTGVTRHTQVASDGQWVFGWPGFGSANKVEVNGGLLTDIFTASSVNFNGGASMFPFGATEIRVRDSANAVDLDLTARNITASGTFAAAAASFSSLDTATLTITTNLVFGATNSVPVNTNAVLWLPVVVGGVTGSVPWMANP